jgi:hypothetical protein
MTPWWRRHQPKLPGEPGCDGNTCTRQAHNRQETSRGTLIIAYFSKAEGIAKSFKSPAVNLRSLE